MKIATLTRAAALLLAGAALLGWGLELEAQAPAGEEGDGPVEPPPSRAPFSWISDRPTLTVGDVVTVVVDELTLASADEAENADRFRDRDFVIGLDGNRNSIRARNDSRRSVHGSSARQGAFSTEITARVVEANRAGVLRIEGTKTLQIDDHEQVVRLRGWLRPEDVSLQNTVDSWRLADAELEFETEGELTSTGGGILSRSWI